MKVLFKEVPEGTNFKENHYTELPARKALQYISEGYGKAYDSEAQKEEDILLEEDFPHRDVLFKNGIYTPQILEVAFPVLQDLDGIGPKKAEEIESAFRDSEEQKTGPED